MRRPWAFSISPHLRLCMLAHICAPDVPCTAEDAPQSKSSFFGGKKGKGEAKDALRQKRGDDDGYALFRCEGGCG